MLNVVVSVSVFFFVRRLFQSNCLQVLHRGRNPEAEPPGQHSGQEKRNFEQEETLSRVR